MQEPLDSVFDTEGAQFLRGAERGKWLFFSCPRRIILVEKLCDVLPQLRAIEEACRKEHLFAAGFISYEAAPAFDAALTVCPGTKVPLLWFGLYDKPGSCTLPILPNGDFQPPAWTPSVSGRHYRQSVAAVKDHIARGETYQVNYTIRQHADADMTPRNLFFQMAANAPYGAFLNTGSQVICSGSPELFFRYEHGKVTTRPMKGTASRGPTGAEDRKRAEWLRSSEKNRAENVMIVDMIRNDLGRVAQKGTVRVDSLFDIERYPTLWQMTSTVSAETDASVTDVMQALFPCASVTGAPKVQTMKIIAGLEQTPRNVYTGAIGCITPNGFAQFSVAIRTVLIDLKSGQAEYGVGGGIVWDSDPDEEYAEVVMKTQLTRSPLEARNFALLETIKWSPDTGFFLLDEHLRRLADTAGYFDYPCDAEAVRAALENLKSEFSSPQRIRLLLDSVGRLTLERQNLNSPEDGKPVRLRLAPAPIDRNDPFLYHKTTHRIVYEQARSSFEQDDCDDVLLWNTDEEITETCIANIAVQLDGVWITPPVSSGLLNGTFRQHLLDTGKLREGVISLSDIRLRPPMAVVNSVRGWREAVLDARCWLCPP